MKRKHYFSRFVLLLFIPLLTLCSVQQDEGKLPKEEEIVVSSGKEAILFIGNSHTYYNQGISTHLARFRAIYGKPPSNNPYKAALDDEVANYLKTKAN